MAAFFRGLGSWSSMWRWMRASAASLMMAASGRARHSARRRCGRVMPKGSLQAAGKEAAKGAARARKAAAPPAAEVRKNFREVRRLNCQKKLRGIELLGLKETTAQGWRIGIRYCD